ncbi:MAG: flagellar biosynthetic protein FliO [Burkholderiaceae bacterium]
MDMLLNALPAFGLLLIMVVMAVVLKRMRPHMARASGQQGPALRVLSSVSLGPQQRLVSVQVGDGPDSTCLVLGVAPGAIQTLHTLAMPPQTHRAPQPTTPTGDLSFAARLARLTKGPHDAP